MRVKTWHHNSVAGTDVLAWTEEDGQFVVDFDTPGYSARIFLDKQETKAFKAMCRRQVGLDRASAKPNRPRKGQKPTADPAPQPQEETTVQPSVTAFEETQPAYTYPRRKGEGIKAYTERTKPAKQPIERMLTIDPSGTRGFVHIRWGCQALWLTAEDAQDVAARIAQAATRVALEAEDPPKPPVLPAYKTIIVDGKKFKLVPEQEE